MDGSSPDGESRGATRRKSGRVVRKPDTLITSSATKRKRDEEEMDDVEMEDASEAEVDESEDEEPDEEIREKKRRVKKAKTSKPAPKKAKPNVNGQAVTSLAIRPAKGKKKTKTKTKAQRNSAAEAAGGLYGKFLSLCAK